MKDGALSPTVYARVPVIRMLKVYSLTPKNRVAAIAVAVGVVGVGVVIVFVGFALLAALTVAGAVLGTGVATYRWLRGTQVVPELRLNRLDLDPSLEVRSAVRGVPASVEPADADGLATDGDRASRTS